MNRGEPAYALGRWARSGAARGPAGQRGQALTEMAILAVVLVPLFLLIPLLGKYAHLQQNAQQAARAAAWEATVVRDYEMAGLDRAAQQARLIERHFGDAQLPISTQLPQRDQGDLELGGSMYNTHSDQALLETEDIVLQEYQFEDQPGLTNTITGMFPDWLPGSFPPSRNGLVTASLELNPKNLRYADGSPASDTLNLAPFDAIDLQFRASHTLLADAWGAAGSGITGASRGRTRNFYEQVRSLVPSTSLSFLGDGLDDLGFLRIIPVLGVLGDLRPGYAQDVMDVVPEDRLQEYPGGP